MQWPVGLPISMGRDWLTKIPSVCTANPQAGLVDKETERMHRQSTQLHRAGLVDEDTERMPANPHNCNLVRRTPIRVQL